MGACQELPHERDDVPEAGLQRPVAGVEHVQLGVGKVSEVGAARGFGHVAVVGTPEDQRRRPVLAQVSLLALEPAQRRGLILEEGEDVRAALGRVAMVG